MSPLPTAPAGPSAPALAFALAGTLGCALLVSGLPDLRADAWVLVGAGLTWAGCAAVAAWTLRREAAAPAVVLGVAVLLRALLLRVEPQLSDDLHRYLWEGVVQSAGFNPFLHPPDAPALDGLAPDLRGLVNHRGVSTIYPPGALLLFRGVAVAWTSPMAWKLLAGAADLVVLGLLVRITRGRGVKAWAPTLYALHPLPILESAGSGHLESIAMVGLAGALLAADRGRPGRAAVAAALGALVKVLPAVTVVPLLRRPDRRLFAGLAVGLALGLLTALPYVDAGPTLLRGFGRYYEAWAFNAALFPLLERFAGEQARGLGVALGAAWCAVAAWRQPDPARFTLAVAAALLMLSPVVHPWYVLWALVPALACGSWPWAVLASTTLLSYSVLASYDAATGSWTEASWVPWLEYPPLLLALAWQRLRERPSEG